MGESTNGYVRDKISATDIFSVIVNKFDKDAIFNVREDRNGEIGKINFSYNEEVRGLFYCLGEVEDNRNMKFENGKYAYLSFSNWGSSVQIMTEIVKQFGGYVDENDCDDEEAFYVPQSENFQYSSYVKERENIMCVLDNGLDQSLKIQIATQVLQHKEQLLELLSK